MFKNHRKSKYALIATGLAAATAAGTYAFRKFKNPE